MKQNRKQNRQISRVVPKQGRQRYYIWDGNWKGRNYEDGFERYQNVRLLVVGVSVLFCSRRSTLWLTVWLPNSCSYLKQSGGERREWRQKRFKRTARLQAWLSHPGNSSLESREIKRSVPWRSIISKTENGCGSDGIKTSYSKGKRLKGHANRPSWLICNIKMCALRRTGL